jgi:hypothetical protein
VNRCSGRNAARWSPPWAERNVALTPPGIVAAVRRALGGEIGLDPCTEPDNPTGALRWYALPIDGLAQARDASSIFCNPPWGDAARPWAARCLELGQAGRRVILLVPAAPETYLGQALLAGADETTFIAGRLTFGRRGDGKPFAYHHPTALHAWGCTLADAELGVTVQALREPSLFGR